MFFEALPRYLILCDVLIIKTPLSAGGLAFLRNQPADIRPGVILKTHLQRFEGEGYFPGGSVAVFS